MTPRSRKSLDSALTFSDEIFDSYVAADEDVLSELKTGYETVLREGVSSKQSEISHRKVLTLVTAVLVLRRHPGVRRVKYESYDDLWVCRVCGCGATEPDLLLHQPCRVEV